LRQREASGYRYRGTPARIDVTTPFGSKPTLGIKEAIFIYLVRSPFCP
jgi:hypothetical protein